MSADDELSTALNDEYIAAWLEGHRRPTTRPPGTWRTLWANRIEAAGVFLATLSWDVADVIRGRR